jgi:sodium-dependent dicarboxylate transporter 2/3/5
VFSRDNVSLYGLIIGLFILPIFIFSDPPEGLSRIGWLTAGVALLMTIWWVTEAIPIYFTGIIPLVLFPIFNIFDLKLIASSYAHPLVLLFLGGFIIASAMEACGLHKRIALNILSLSGTSPSKIIAGFMITTALISMWVSNTASTIMMLPIALSVIAIFSKEINLRDEDLAIPLLLAIAYSASIGGASTLIGTPTNIMLAGILSDSYNYEISFIDWLLIALPIALFLLPVVWFFLTNISFKVSKITSDALENTIINMKKETGKSSFTEKVVATVFILTAFLWILRKNINEIFNLNLNDTSIGLFGALLLFLVPTGKKTRACDWQIANKIPWGVLLLVGGGIALSKAFNVSGLATWIGSFSYYFSNYDLFILIIFAVGVIIFLTELNSNTATIATFSPILIIFAIGINQNPLFLVIPATIAASCAFMLPIATPPNAVIFGSGKIKISDMVRAGFLLNIISLLIISVVGFVVIPYVFDININTLPVWANQ